LKSGRWGISSGLFLDLDDEIDDGGDESGAHALSFSIAQDFRVLHYLQ
jgi:hypothetical protein